MAEKLVNDTGLAEFASKVKEKAVFIKESQGGTPAILDLIYPIGSIYMSVNNVSPQEFLGGTWVRIKDTFLLSAGDTYSAGSTGGEATHKLTESEMPGHSHKITTYGDESSAGATTREVRGTEYAHSALEATHSTSSVGGNQPHNNMPPYLVVYMWKRTA